MIASTPSSYGVIGVVQQLTRTSRGCIGNNNLPRNSLKVYDTDGGSRPSGTLILRSVILLLDTVSHTIPYPYTRTERIHTWGMSTSP